MTHYLYGLYSPDLRRTGCWPETRIDGAPFDRTVYHYRLVDEETGADLGPFASPRLAFQVGETIATRPGARYAIRRVVPTEHDEPFRAYLVVTPGTTGHDPLRVA